MRKIVAINLGSTSTKIAYYEDDVCKLKESITHAASDLANFDDVFEQAAYRSQTVLAFLEENGIDIADLSAFVSRGPQTEPVEAGVYRISQDMLDQARSGAYGSHVCSVGCQIAYDLAQQYGFEALTVDTPCVDEMEPIARFSGLAEIERRPSFQALNHRAMARYYAEQNGRSYEDMNLVVVMLGGGVSVVAHEHGRMVDGPDALEGDGPFSNNRCCTVPVGQLVRLCYSGRYTEEQMMRHINGEAGLFAYLGETDTRKIEQRIGEGDERAREVLDAMCYQTAKEIGAYATVLKGDVDAILLIGGMANSAYITERIRERVSFIAPVVVQPGEREMESLCLNALDALEGRCPIKTFVPSARA